MSNTELLNQGIHQIHNHQEGILSRQVSQSRKTTSLKARQTRDLDLSRHLRGSLDLNNKVALLLIPWSKHQSSQSLQLRSPLLNPRDLYLNPPLRPQPKQILALCNNSYSISLKSTRTWQTGKETATSTSLRKRR